MVWSYILIFLISCLFLIRSGTRIVKSLTKIARYLEWKEFVVASLLMAFTTSLPESFVGIFSAFHETPQLSFGNVIGSNIVALTLIIGMGALITGNLKFQGKTLQKSSIFAPFTALIPLLFILDGQLSRLDGGILILTAVFYFYWLLSQKREFAQTLSKKLKNRDSHFQSFLKSLGAFFISIFLLLLSSEGIVWSITKFAQELNLPLLFMGLFFVAIGTSIPEIAFGIKSITMGRKQMILGDAMGSVVVNSSFVLGITALICPFEIPGFSPYLAGILFTAITGFFFTFFAKTEREITRKEACALIFIYILFVITELLI
jgi:cation:H+ antiporter